jgi:hypothetical protein
VEAAFDKSEGNGRICDEEIGKEARGKMGLMSVFGMRGSDRSYTYLQQIETICGTWPRGFSISDSGKDFDSSELKRRIS